jgi:NADPH:quinone reductase-like Zn-dependent oxidoreductase
MIGPLTHMIAAFGLSRFGSQKFVGLLARNRQDDLKTMRELMESGKVTPVIDRRYRLSEVPEAIGYLEEGHARGKVVISLEGANQT